MTLEFAYRCYGVPPVIKPHLVDFSELYLCDEGSFCLDCILQRLLNEGDTDKYNMILTESQRPGRTY